MRIRIASMLALGAAVVLLAFSGSAGAITKGVYDGNGHPYVAYLDNGVFSCSGTLLSSTVLLTAAHCFSDGPSAYGQNTGTGAPLVRVTFNPNLANTPADQTSGGGAATTGIPGSPSPGAAGSRASTRTTSPL